MHSLSHEDFALGSPCPLRAVPREGCRRTDVRLENKDDSSADVSHEAHELEVGKGTQLCEVGSAAENQEVRIYS